MSLKTALISGTEIKVENDILTISDINKSDHSTLYSCFIQDIQLNHPQLGKGKVIDFKNGKWVCDFEYSTALQEVKSKTIVNYIN